MKFLDTFRQLAIALFFLGIGCGKQADIHRRSGRRETLCYRVVTLLLEMQESLIEPRFRIVAIQLERLSKQML